MILTLMNRIVKINFLAPPLCKVAISMVLGRMEAWWKVQEVCEGKLYDNLKTHFPRHDCKKFMNLFIFNEKSFPSQVSSLAVQG
jgi:hypothetical protein